MDDLISRQTSVLTLLEKGQKSRRYKLGEIWELNFDEIREALETVPSVDAVEVVRCGECKHMSPVGVCTYFADSSVRPSASDFCSYGERKTDG